MIGRPAWTIIENVIGEPSSCEMSAAISSWRSWSLQRDQRCTGRRGLRSGTWLHDSNAARAAATARSTSSAVPSGMRPMTSSVEALTTSIVPSDDGSTHWPPM